MKKAAGSRDNARGKFLVAGTGSKDHAERLKASMRTLGEKTAPWRIREQGRTLARGGSWSSLWSTFFTRASETEEVDPNAQVASDENDRKVVAADIRDWIMNLLQLPAAETASKRVWIYPDSPHGEAESDKDNGKPEYLLTLVVQQVDIFDYLDLSDLKASGVKLIFDQCRIDIVSLSNSEFHSIKFWDQEPADWDAWILRCEGAKLSGKLEIVNSKVFHVGAHGLTCSAVEIWKCDFLGGDFLEWLKKKDKEYYKEWFADASRSLDLTDANLETALLFNCNITSLVSFRGARVRGKLGLESCEFRGYEVAPLSEGSEDPGKFLDRFDYDDIMSGFMPLRGLTLDVSRASMGLLSVRDIKKGSRGWWNFSHAHTNVLEMDFEFWEKPTKLEEKPTKLELRHRLDGFIYDAVLNEGLQRQIVKGDTEEEFDKGQKVKTPRERTDPPVQDTARQKNAGSTKAVRRRINWLKAQLENDLKQDFKAQPWTVAARTFHISGDYAQAKELLYSREWHAHQALLWRDTRPIRNRLLWTLHWVNFLHGYGYRLGRTVMLMAALWIGGMFFYDWQFQQGYLMPNPDTGGLDIVQMADDVAQAGLADPGAGIPALSVSPGPLQSVAPGVPRNEFRARSKYPKFKAWLYSLDVMIPVIHFSQEEYWIPGYRVREAELRDTARTGSSNETMTWASRVASGAEGDGIGLQRMWLFYWFQIVIGYALTTVLGLGMVGYLERRPPA